jgi:adenosylcobinamide kinase / adenosylcobinamide-phosphate guanylyltransferase
MLSESELSGSELSRPGNGKPEAANRSLLVVGGARSGKSRLAQELAQGAAAELGGGVTFVATATAGDSDMATRIARHQADRPGHWGLVEAPIDLADAVAGTAPDETLVIDCLTLWVANLVFAEHTDAGIEGAAGTLARLVSVRRSPTIVVSNEVGMGVHPPSELGRRYQDLLGRVNQITAAAAGRTLLVVAGRALELQSPAQLVAGWLRPGS